MSMTGQAGGEAHWPTAGESAPRGKCPSWPITMIGDIISHPLFLHYPQKYQPVHCWPAFRHLHALVERPLVEQVKFQVHLQHHSTGLQIYLTDGKITVELIPTPP